VPTNATPSRRRSELSVDLCATKPSVDATLRPADPSNDGQRMIEDMNARKLGAHSQKSHIYSCRRLAAFLDVAAVFVEGVAREIAVKITRDLLARAAACLQIMVFPPKDSGIICSSLRSPVAPQ